MERDPQRIGLNERWRLLKTLINHAYKTELAPNNIQRTHLLKSAGTARFAYNWGLARWKEEYERTGKSSNAIRLHRQLNALKRTDFPWMYEVSKCAPQEALRDLEDAFQRFFKGQARYRRFKSKKNGVGSFTLTGAVKVGADRIQLPRLGIIRLKERNYLPADHHILSVTVSEHAGRWFVSVLVSEESGRCFVWGVQAATMVQESLVWFEAGGC